MNWYYLDETGQVAGPVAENSLVEMRSNGTLSNDSKICREGTENWITLEETLGNSTHVASIAENRTLGKGLTRTLTRYISIRGYLRLSAVIWVSCFAYLGFSGYKKADDLRSELASRINFTSLWSEIIATPEYRSKTDEEKARQAQEYYQDRIAGLVSALNYDEAKFRSWFMAESLAEHEIQNLNKYRHGMMQKAQVAYLNLSSKPRENVPLYFLSVRNAFLALAVTAATITSLVFVTNLIMWIVNGFKGTK